MISSVLIRLAPRLTRCSGAVFCGVKFGVSWGGNIAGDAEQGAKCVKWIESAVETEGELVEVCL